MTERAPMAWAQAPMASPWASGSVTRTQTVAVVPGKGSVADFNALDQVIVTGSAEVVHWETSSRSACREAPVEY